MIGATGLDLDDVAIVAYCLFAVENAAAATAWCVVVAENWVVVTAETLQLQCYLIVR